MVRRTLVFAWLMLAIAGGCADEDSPTPVPVAARAEAISATSVEVSFSKRVDPDSVAAQRLAVTAPFGTPSDALEVAGARVDGDVLTVTTSEQVGGRPYALDLSSIRFEGITLADAPLSVSFRGFGLTPIELRLDTAGRVVPRGIDALITLDPDTGRARPDFARISMSDDDGDGVWVARTRARIGDDTYAARAVASNGSEAGALRSFTATSSETLVVELLAQLPLLPEFDPPVDPNPGDGKAPIRIILDDRPARALASPSFRSSVDRVTGEFDASLERLDPLEPIAGKPKAHELTLYAAIDQNRTLDGTEPATYPYLAFLVEGGEDFPQRGLTFVVHDETPQVIVVPVGNPALVPVTFRVDAGSAFLEPDGRLRGVYPGEGVFLTGELADAEDALGRLAADAFLGGERTTLEMKPRPDAPSVYEKTIFLKPNRPAGWKVVRCPTGVGCSELNRHVTSSGRAFPTVMKNLTTANRDAASDSSIAVADPANLSSVVAPDGTRSDYSGAMVSESGDDPPGPGRLFKQEAPDLVVAVGTSPLVTPIYIVGTWRDVNIPGTPLDIIARGDVLSLGEYDYDDGLAGRSPLIRDLDLPLDPGETPPIPGQPAFTATDGTRDPVAKSAGDADRTPLWVSWNGRDLYVATDPAGPGRDRFVIVSLESPTETHPSPWAKTGAVASSARTYFLAMEGDGDFASWFSLDSTGAETRIASAPASHGVVLEGALDLGALGPPPDRVWVSTAAYGTLNGDPLDASSQNPRGDGDFELETNELFEAELSRFRAR